MRDLIEAVTGGIYKNNILSNNMDMKNANQVPRFHIRRCRLFLVGFLDSSSLKPSHREHHHLGGRAFACLKPTFSPSPPVIEYNYEEEHQRDTAWGQRNEHERAEEGRDHSSSRLLLLPQPAVVAPKSVHAAPAQHRLVIDGVWLICRRIRGKMRVRAERFTG
jgi:hypothetical protein